MSASQREPNRRFFRPLEFLKYLNSFFNSTIKKGNPSARFFERSSQ